MIDHAILKFTLSAWGASGSLLGMRLASMQTIVPEQVAELGFGVCFGFFLLACVRTLWANNIRLQKEKEEESRRYSESIEENSARVNRTNQELLAEIRRLNDK